MVRVVSSSSGSSLSSSAATMKLMMCLAVGLLLLLMTMSSMDKTAMAVSYEIKPSGESNSDNFEEGIKKAKLTNDLSAGSDSSKSAGSTTVKTEWPELVGIDGEAAKSKITEERPDLNKVQVVPSDAMMTMDYREDRVRVLVDKGNKVVKPPRIG